MNRRSQYKCDKDCINAAYTEIRAWLGRLSRCKRDLPFDELRTPLDRCYCQDVSDRTLRCGAHAAQIRFDRRCVGHPQITPPLELLI